FLGQDIEIQREVGGSQEVGIDLQDLLDHAIDQVAHLAGDIQLVGENVVAQERQAVYGVIEVCRSCQWQDVARNLLSLLLEGVGHAPLRLRAARLGARWKDLRVAVGDIRG